jgi:type VI secretion system effector, Hcp1 family
LRTFKRFRAGNTVSDARKRQKSLFHKALSTPGMFLDINLAPNRAIRPTGHLYFLARRASMATPAYMSITGTKQGLITAGAFTADSVGNTYQEGHEDQVMVQGFQHEVIIPRDPQSGQPTGQRVHKPVVITKVFDKASPLLLAALTSGERLTKIEIQWYRTSAAGTQEHYYTTTLEDAIIVDIKDYMHNCQDPANSHFTHLEDVHFTYRKITWTHEVSGTSGSDDWRSPVAG